MRRRALFIAGLVLAPTVAPIAAPVEGSGIARTRGQTPVDPPTTAGPASTTSEPPTTTTRPPTTATPDPPPPMAPQPVATTSTTVPTAPPTAVPPVDAPPTAIPPTEAPNPDMPGPQPGAADRNTPTTAPATTPATTPALTPVPPAAPTDVHLAASVYDSVYANGLPLGTAMAATRFLESGNNYQAQAAKASASGAYQIIDRFWNNYGGYPRAYLAPPAVQDQFAYEHFVGILKRNGNNLASIPVSWYYPAALRNPALMDTVPMPEAGNRLTIREYQTKWLTKFFELLAQGAPPFLPADHGPLIPSIAFPVLGPVQFWHDYGAPRGEHGHRFHEGLDLIGSAGQPLRAAFDGVITRIQLEPHGISGVVLTITRSDGVRANYFHLNDDVPGGDGNAAPDGLRIHPHVQIGTTVKAGQIVAYMGNTGNAVHVPHLHFELRTPQGVPIDPYPAVLAAQQREQCSVGIGPWSTDFFSPTEEAQAQAEVALLPQRDRAVLVAMVAATPAPPVHRIAIGPDGARWEIDEAGHVRAVGVGAVIQPGSGTCSVLPPLDLVYGTDAAGVARHLLPTDWWNVGVAYSGAVLGDDLGGGDGEAGWATAPPPSPPPTTPEAANRFGRR
jgi:hypothetical protein